MCSRFTYTHSLEPSFSFNIVKILKESCNFILFSPAEKKKIKPIIRQSGFLCFAGFPKCHLDDQENSKRSPQPEGERGGGSGGAHSSVRAQAPQLPRRVLSAGSASGDPGVAVRLLAPRGRAWGETGGSEHQSRGPPRGVGGCAWVLAHLRPKPPPRTALEMTSI